MGEMLAASRLFGMVVRDGEWLTWMMLGMFSGMTTYGDACEEVVIISWRARSFPFRPSGYYALVEGGASGAMPFRFTSIRGGS